MTPRKKRISLGKRIRSMRKARKLSLRDLNKLSGVTISYISQLERGDAQNPSLKRVSMIAKGLGVDLSDLLSEERDEDGNLAGLTLEDQSELREFLETMRHEGNPVPEEDVRMLEAINLRGHLSSEDFAALYQVIKKFVK